MRWNNAQAQVTLFLTSVRTGVQEAAAEGSAKKTDFGFGGIGFAGVVGGAGGTYTSTDIGKITAAAFLDAHNKLVAQVRATQPASTRPSESGYVTLSGVNLRSGPSTSSPVVTMLSKGIPVTPTGEQAGDWWAEEADGRTGWIHADYIAR